MATGKSENLAGNSAEYRSLVEGIHTQADITIKENSTRLMCELMDSSKNVADKTLVNLGAEGIKANVAGNYKEAESDFKSALTTNPANELFNTQVRSNLGLTLLQEDKFSEAEVNCRQVLKDLDADKSHSAHDEQLNLDILMTALILQGKNDEEVMRLADRSIAAGKQADQEDKTDLERAFAACKPLYIPMLP